MAAAWEIARELSLAGADGRAREDEYTEEGGPLFGVWRGRADRDSVA